MNLISIITICFNNLKETIATCESVDIQKSSPFEHIIIDGSSKPDIQDYLESTRQPLYRKWVCESDKGIADAFNKGIKMATGNIVVMLNSGDTFYDANTIETVTNLFKLNSEIKWLHSKYQLIRGNQEVIIGKPFEKEKLYRGMRSVCHQTMFIKKELHDKYGLYNTDEKIGMDYDFLCRIANENFLFTKSVLINFAPAGASSKMYLKALKDAKRIYNKHFGNSFKLWLWQIRLRSLYYLLKSPIGNFLYKIKRSLKLENM